MDKFGNLMEAILEEGIGNSNILAWRIPMDRGAWQGTVHGVTKSQTINPLPEIYLKTQLCTQFRGSRPSLVAQMAEFACNAGDLGSVPASGMAAHSRILTWRIPWTEGPWFMGLQRPFHFRASRVIH